MNIYQVFITFRFLLGCMLFVLAGVIIVCSGIYEELAIQSSYHRQFGSEWVQAYERHFGAGSLTEANEKMVIGVVAIPLIFGIIWLIGREIQGKRGSGPFRRRRRKHRRELSH